MMKIAKAGDLAKVQALKFDKKHLKWAIELANGEDVVNGKQSVKILTYNVWFEKVNWENRLKALVSIFEKADADFICLQEVTPDFVSFLEKNSFVKDNYYMNVGLNYTYDVLILSKSFPHYHHLEFPTMMDRRLLTCEVDVSTSLKLTVATAHFESLEHSDKERKVQLELTFAHLNSLSNSVVLTGDFNFDPSWQSEQANVDKNYSDAFVSAKSAKLIEDSEAGFTMPAWEHFNAWRPDRILLKSNNKLSLQRFEIVGKEEVEQDGENNLVKTASDHYGLLAEFKILQ